MALMGFRCPPSPSKRLFRPLRDPFGAPCAGCSVLAVAHSTAGASARQHSPQRPRSGQQPITVRFPRCCPGITEDMALTWMLICSSIEVVEDKS